MKPDRTRAAVSAFATLVIFTLVAGDFWRYTIGWWGFLALGLVLAVTSAVLIIRLHPVVRWRRMPKLLALFLLFATVSLAWSFYPGASVLGLLATYSTTIAALFLALCLSWDELLRALANAYRILLGGSLLFELVVSLVIRHKVLPFWTDYGDKKLPEAFYWSRDLLFHGGQIQGLQGNSNLLMMAALVGLIIFSVQLADRTVRRGTGIFWIAVAVIVMALTRSSTVIVATVLVAGVLVFVLWTRAARPSRRLPIYATMLVVAVVAGGIVWRFAPLLLSFLGKSDNLTGRLGIWQSVIDLAVKRPVFGWGWISYWAPWVEPFKGLAVRNGVTYLQAHNAWLDVWLQLGIVGLVIFILLVVSTLWRTWFLAVDRPRTESGSISSFTAISLLPILILTALIAQSAAESRILVEIGWALLVVITIKTKLVRS